MKNLLRYLSVASLLILPTLAMPSTTFASNNTPTSLAQSNTNQSATTPLTSVKGSCGVSAIYFYGGYHAAQARWAVSSSCGPIIAYELYVNWYKGASTTGSPFYTEPFDGLADSTYIFNTSQQTSLSPGNYCVTLTGSAVTANGTIEHSLVPYSCGSVS
jgi:hypothetical protein